MAKTIRRAIRTKSKNGYKKSNKATRTNDKKELRKYM